MRSLRSVLFSLLLLGLIVASGLMTGSPRRMISGGHHGAISVLDGDTLRIGKRTIRLLAIDAPETRQQCLDEAGRRWPCGQAASARLSQLVREPGLVCVSRAIDRFGRALAICSTNAVPDIGEALVGEGLATTYAGRGGDLYDGAEQEAREARRGMWRGSFDPPREWRSIHPRGGSG